MQEYISKLIDRFQKEGRKTQTFFQALTPEEWGREIYSEGTVWTVRQIFAHLVSAESGIARLVQHILDGGQGVPEDFDLDRYNERKVGELDGKTTDELMVMFSNLRGETIKMVATLGDEDLSREGRHPWLGMATLGDMLKLMYRHNKIHQREIRRVLD
ncbi:MAG: DinB family protein [Anaerolineales bacterium]|jgi:hypothetical protein